MAMSADEVETRIRNVRCRKGLSQAQLAGGMGCTASHVSQIESGQTSVTVSKILLAAQYLSVDPRSIMIGLAAEVLELAETLSPKTQVQASIGHTQEVTKLVKHLLGKPQAQQQKALAAWKAVLEMA